MSRAKCSVCAHAQAPAIAAALEAGLRNYEVATQFGVSKFALSRHKNKCLAPVPTGDGERSTGEQLDKWLSRADDLYQIAGVNGDVKSQVAALSAAVRSLQAEQKRAEKKEEQEAKGGLLPNGQTPVTVEYLDALIAKHIASCPVNSCPLCGGKTRDGVSLDPAPDGKTAREMTQ